MECEEIPYQIPTAPWDCCIFTDNEWLNLMVFCRVYIPVPKGASGNDFLWKIILTHGSLTSLEC